MVESAERGDFAGARATAPAAAPALQVNFIESNPIPVKAAMASLGLLEEVYRLPMVPPGRRVEERIDSRARVKCGADVSGDRAGAARCRA